MALIETTCHAMFSRRKKRNVLVVLLIVTVALTRLVALNTRIFVSVRSLSSKKNKTTDTGEALDEKVSGEDAILFYNTTWPPLQRVLCGKGHPNLMLGKTLFELAREETFLNHYKGNADNATRTILDPDRIESFGSQTGKPSTTLVNFFLGDFGTTFFHGTNQQGHQFATLYVKIWKCGNNQIRWMEKKLFKHYDGVYLGKSRKLSLREALNEYVYTRNKTDGTYTYNFADTTPPPCVYTAIRDPISHFLSGYNEVEVRQLGEYNNGSSSEFPQNATPAPYHLEVPYSNSSSDLRKARFIAFVRDVLFEEPVFSSHYIYSHFFSMSRILSLLERFNTQLTGYIPSLDNITTTWPTFIASNCQNAPPIDEFPKMKKQGQHRSSRDRLGLYQAAKDVWQDAGPVAKSLCLLHAFDYACYEDLPDGIPLICRETYRQYAEQIETFGTTHFYDFVSTPRTS